MPVAALKPRNAVESLRDIVQDFLVPEMKSVKTSIDSLHNEMHTSLESVRTEMRLRDEKQTAVLEHLTANISQLSDKLDRTLEIRERLASIEARLPRA